MKAKASEQYAARLQEIIAEQDAEADSYDVSWFNARPKLVALLIEMSR